MTTEDKYKKYITCKYKIACCFDNEVRSDSIYFPSGWWCFNEQEKFIQTFHTTFGSFKRDCYQDCPENWNMHFLIKSDNLLWWDVGYINNRTTDFKNLSGYPVPNTYWWCRCHDWLPFWGELTKQKSRLIQDINLYWKKKYRENRFNLSIVLYQWDKHIDLDLIQHILMYIPEN